MLLSVYIFVSNVNIIVYKSMQMIMSNMWPGKGTCGSASSNVYSAMATVIKKKGL